MSKKFNVKDIINERKNELDYSPLFQSKSTSTTKDESSTTLPLLAFQQNSNPAYQKARMLEIWKSSITSQLQRK
jgi:hypothetical protein